MTKSTLVNQIKADSIQAMKDKDTAKLATLRLLIAELEKEKVAHKLTEVTGLSDAQAEAVISRQVKKLNKEMEAYIKVGQGVEKQEAEKVLLQSYLPKQLTDEELTEIIVEIGTSVLNSGQQIGQALKEVAQRVKGKADMGKASKLTKDFFSKE